jgi:hypothetical protein
VTPAGLRLVKAYGHESDNVLGSTLRIVRGSWLELSDYHEPSINRWVRLVAPRLEAAQSRMGSLTSAYLASLERAETGASVKPVALAARDLTSTALRGVPADELMRRAGERVWRALADGSRVDEATRQGLDRAMSMTDTNVQLARTHAALQSVGSNDNVVGYRRVLQSARPCALCAVASTQRYHRQALMPIHPGCHCSVATIFGTGDTGQIIDPNRLADIHAEVAKTFGADATDAREVNGVLTAQGDVAQYRDLVVVHTHGEIGPVLGVRGQTFTGPGDIAAAA